jgi:glucose-6-phosphate 1-dehydrogenase
MVIFGAAGDLTKRLLVPALYNLATTKLLPEYFELIGVDLADLDTNAWRDSLHKMMESFVGHAASESRIDKVDEDTWKRLTNHITYIKGDLNDDGLYGKLKPRAVSQADGSGPGTMIRQRVRLAIIGAVGERREIGLFAKVSFSRLCHR